MQLFERVRYLKKFSGSLDLLAKSIGLTPQKLSAYSNEKSQKNLYAYLPIILKKYPKIRREWLYFGEKPILKDDNEQLNNVDENILKQISILIEENKKLVEANNRLVKELTSKNK